MRYYKAEDLDVTTMPPPQYENAAQLVATGRADFGLGSSDQVLEWNSNGLPFVAVSATMQHDPQANVLHGDSAILDFKDMERHTIAAQTGGAWFKCFIGRYGLHQVR